MRAFNAILGIFAILGAVYCLFFPGVAFITEGWLVMVLIGSWGFCSIFDYISARKNHKEAHGSEAAMGGFGLAVAIVAAVFSVLALFMPKVDKMLDIAILAILAAWLIFSGIGMAATAVVFRRKGRYWWLLPFILGILILIAGIYGVANLIFLAQAVGVATGILLAVYGVSLLLSAFERKE